MKQNHMKSQIMTMNSLHPRRFTAGDAATDGKEISLGAPSTLDTGEVIMIVNIQGSVGASDRLENAKIEIYGKHSDVSSSVGLVECFRYEIETDPTKVGSRSGICVIPINMLPLKPYLRLYIKTTFEATETDYLDISIASIHASGANDLNWLLDPVTGKGSVTTNNGFPRNQTTLALTKSEQILEV